MPGFGKLSSCVYPETLVLIEALPLCRIVASDGSEEELPSDLPLLDEEVEAESIPEHPMRCAALMPCADALALLEEVGYAEW